MNKPILPEDKLLKLIKGTGGVTSSPRKLKLFFPVKSVRMLSRSITGEFLSIVKYCLRIVVVLSCLTLMCYAGLLISGYVRIMPEIPVIVNDAINQENLQIPIKPFNEYLNLVNSKNIFMVISAAVNNNRPVVEEKNAAEIISGFNLIGIVDGADPKAIIEEKAAAKSVFLRKGETIGSAKVEEIGNGKVLLRINDEVFTLML
jgi:hypothetical protein